MPAKKGASVKICMKGEVDEIKEVKDKTKVSNKADWWKRKSSKMTKRIMVKVEIGNEIVEKELIELNRETKMVAIGNVNL